MDNNAIGVIIDVINGNTDTEIIDKYKEDYYRAADKISCLFEIITYRLNQFKYRLLTNEIECDNRICKPIPKELIGNIINIIVGLDLDDSVLNIWSSLPSGDNQISVTDKTKIFDLMSALMLMHKWSTTLKTNSTAM